MSWSLAPPAGRQPGYLCFLRAQVVERVGRALARALTSGPELDPGALGERFGRSSNGQLPTVREPA